MVLHAIPNRPRLHPYRPRLCCRLADVAPLHRSHPESTAVSTQHRQARIPTLLSPLDRTAALYRLVRFRLDEFGTKVFALDCADVVLGSHRDCELRHLRCDDRLHGAVLSRVCCFGDGWKWVRSGFFSGHCGLVLSSAVRESWGEVSPE